MICRNVGICGIRFHFGNKIVSGCQNGESWPPLRSQIQFFLTLAILSSRENFILYVYKVHRIWVKSSGCCGPYIQECNPFISMPW